eukprot:9204553-Alexandrium_andersonii.AAC.1
MHTYAEYVVVADVSGAARAVDDLGDGGGFLLQLRLLPYVEPRDVRRLRSPFHRANGMRLGQ